MEKNMTNPKFTEEEIEEIVEKFDDDFGLFVTFFMNKHMYNAVDIKTYDPKDGTANKFIVRRVERFEDEMDDDEK